MTTLLAPFFGFLLVQTATTQLVLPDPAPEPVPKILVDAFMQRMAFKTARFTVRIEESRKALQPYVRRFRYEWAPNARCITDLGDDHGMMFANRKTAEVPLGVFQAASSRAFFVNATNDDMWEYGMGRAVHYGPKFSDLHLGSFPDPRSYGLRGSELHRFSPKQYLDMHRKHPRSKAFIVEDEDKNIVHIRHVGEAGPRGHFEMEWWIDTSMGPSVICMQDRYFPNEGRPFGFADVNLTVEQIDGIWWPLRIEYKRSDDNFDRTGVVTFEDIEFDRPTHPQTLDVDMLKIPVGTKVALPPEEGGRATWARYVGNGKVINEDEWQDKKDDYDTEALDAAEIRLHSSDLGRAPEWWDDEGDEYGLPDAASKPDLWDLYVRRWALKRRTNQSWTVKVPLTEEQCKTAQSILDDCRKKASAMERTGIEGQFQILKERLDGLLTEPQRRPDNASWERPPPPPIRLRPPPKAKPIAPWNCWPGGPAVF